MNKLLILNADDLGYDEQTNEAVETLLRGGYITSASLLAPGPAAEDAVRRVKRLGAAVGAHLCLTSDDKTACWRSLSDGRSFRGTLPYALTDLTCGATRRDVRAELFAQLAFLKARGCRIDHADAHAGALYGLAGRRFYLDAFDLAAKAGLPFRLPKTPGFFLRQTGEKAAPAVKALHGALLRQANKRRLLLPDDVFSDPRAPAAIKDRDDLFACYLGAVERCGPGVTELFLHPRMDDAAPGTAWKKRQWEFELLLSGRLQQRAKQCGVRVVSPGEAYARGPGSRPFQTFRLDFPTEIGL